MPFSLPLQPVCPFPYYSHVQYVIGVEDCTRMSETSSKNQSVNLSNSSTHCTTSSSKSLLYSINSNPLSSHLRTSEYTNIFKCLVKAFKYNNSSCVTVLLNGCHVWSVKPSSLCVNSHAKRENCVKDTGIP